MSVGHVILERGGQRDDLERGARCVQRSCRAIDEGAVVRVRVRLLDDRREVGRVVCGSRGRWLGWRCVDPSPRTRPCVRQRILRGLLDLRVEVSVTSFPAVPMPANEFSTSITDAKFSSPF